MTMASRPAPSISRSHASMLRLASSMRLLVPADMLDRGAAAARARDVHHLDIVARQQPHRGLVDLGRQHLLAAARHQRHALAPQPRCRKGLRPVDRRGPGEPVRHRLEHRLQPAQEGGAAGIGACRRQQHRQRLGEPAQHHGPAERRRPRHQPGEHAAQEAIGQRARVARLDVMPAVIDQVHVVHARRAGRHAGQARQAAIDVPDFGLAGRAVALQHRLDEVDAPARAVALVAQQHEGRAGRGAEAAMHALAQDVLAARGLRIGELGQGEVGLHR